MKPEEILALFKQAGALLEGHFLLSSGLHSGRYLQCALVLQHPERAGVLGRELGLHLRQAAGTPDLVIAPALGGILVAHEVARELGVRALFAERQQGRMTLRRGFEIRRDERCIVVEDVLTTGGSTLETMEVVRSAGGVVTAAGCLIDRGSGRAELGVPRVALAVFEIPSFPPESCPMCKTGEQLIKPGSR